MSLDRVRMINTWPNGNKSVISLRIFLVYFVALDYDEAGRRQVRTEVFVKETVNSGGAFYLVTS